MSIRKFDKRLIFRLSMIVGILAILATVTMSAASAKHKGDVSTEVVFVCVKVSKGRMNGEVRIVDAGNKCKNKEIATSWGAGGGAGETGPPRPAR